LRRGGLGIADDDLYIVDVEGDPQPGGRKRLNDARQA
jgi:hypothetical protein